MANVKTNYEVTDYSAPHPEPDKKTGKRPKRATKTVNPEITLRGDAAKAIIEAGLSPGDEFTGEAKFRVSGLSNRPNGDKYDSERTDDENVTVELEIHSLEVEGAEDSDDEGGSQGEESAEDAVDKYLGANSQNGDQGQAGESEEEE